MSPDNKIILRCDHCGNVTPHTKLLEQNTHFLFERIEDEDYYEPFDFHILSCGTCKGLSVLGGFRIEQGKTLQEYGRLYPSNRAFSESVPLKIRRVYDEAWPLRQKAPNAFAGQIRRALEYLCQEQHAKGKVLSEQLNYLALSGVLPKTLVEMTDLIRKVGNTGVHASVDEVDIWDAELIDEFFRAVIEYVYIAPAKVERLKQRLSHKT